MRAISLRAPSGEVGWTLLDFQGAIEPRNGAASLDGIEFGTLVSEVRADAFTRAMQPG